MRKTKVVVVVVIRDVAGGELVHGQAPVVIGRCRARVVYMNKMRNMGRVDRNGTVANKKTEKWQNNRGDDSA